MAECPGEELMARYAAGACDVDVSATIRGHLIKCPKCADWLGEAQAGEAILPDVRAALDVQAVDASRGRLDHGRGASQLKLPAGLIKGYELREELGHGGMAVVYLARQALPERDVAIKVMDTGTASRSGLRRFRYESQFLARLLHPNIAQVYEVGTVRLALAEDTVELDDDRSVPYFVMEYVPDADSIIKHADKHRLEIRARLELFLQVCDAVQHGHQKGVIHRDLKPSNILVGAEGRVKVIDFGVARSTDSDIAATTMQTDVGQIIGTLQYMSPEQCEADPHNLDTRTDVYSLGVVLYELLTRRLPYDVSRTSIYHATRTIRENSPARPSTIDRRLRGDLETIVLKALEKERDKRYQSAADLATDIRRYLAGEPTSARPPTPWTQAMRWTSRHPLKVTAAACVLFVAATLAATAITTWFYNRRPYRIEVWGEGREARLLAYSGSMLHIWGSGRRNEIACAQMLRRAPGLGGELYALVGFTLESESPYRGTLCAFDTSGDRDTPAWQTRIEEKDVPPALLAKGRGPDNCGPFGVGGVITADIFEAPDASGDEIVTVFGMFSQRALRILNEKGEVLFQTWQDGGIKSMYWLSEPGLLVCTGWDEYLKQNDSRFATRPTTPVAPMVFAVRPVRDAALNEFMARTPREQAIISPEWAKYIGPPEDPNLSIVLELHRPVAVDATRFAQLSVVVYHEGSEMLGQVDLLIDEHGKLDADSLGLSDPYLFDQESGRPRLPDPHTFCLLDLPPAPVPPPYLRPNASAPAASNNSPE